MFSSLFDNNLRLFNSESVSSVQQSVLAADIKAFEVSIFPWRSLRDVDGISANCANPVSDSLKSKLWTIVGADKAGMP